MGASRFKVGLQLQHGAIKRSTSNFFLVYRGPGFIAAFTLALLHLSRLEAARRSGHPPKAYRGAVKSSKLQASGHFVSSAQVQRPSLRSGTARVSFATRSGLTMHFTWRRSTT